MKNIRLEKKFSGGFLFLGLIPISITVFLSNSSVTYLALPESWTVASLFWLVILISLGLLVPAIATTQPNHLQKYPQMRIQKWNFWLILLNILTWAAQLFGYELLFRGILLFSSVDVWGEWPAIIINGFLYSFAHFSKGWKEAIGSFPFAVLLCLASVATGSIWIAFIGYLTLAVTNDSLAIRNHSKMVFKYLYM